ncbi:MAG TPA: hypothetical protein VHF45_13280 [Thermoleophilaceae bacterium]|nr:hypothetical protein [Thermoleophilaceae bacterium]
MDLHLIRAFGAEPRLPSESLEHPRLADRGRRSGSPQFPGVQRLKDRVNLAASCGRDPPAAPGHPPRLGEGGREVSRELKGVEAHDQVEAVVRPRKLLDGTDA